MFSFDRFFKMICIQGNELELEGKKISHNPYAWSYIGHEIYSPLPHKTKGKKTKELEICWEVRIAHPRCQGQACKEALEASLSVEHLLSTRHGPKGLNSY